MAITTRMLPANASGGVVTGFAGSPTPNDPSRRYYNANAGQFIDAAGGLDADAAALGQNFIPVCLSGTAATRRSLTPNYFKAGALWLDTDGTIGVIVFDGLSWRNPLTAAAVA
jgi:hypothetical protein